MRSSVDPAELSCASYSPDPAQSDSLEDQLTEAFDDALSDGWGDLPDCFRPLVIDAFRHRFGEEGEGKVGLILQGLVTRQLATARAETLLHVIALILDSDNPALTADCLAFAGGLHSLQGGLSQTQLAERHKVTRAAFSQRVVDYQTQLGMPPSRGMKDLEAQEAYRDSAHKQHGTERTTSQAGKRYRTAVAAIDRVVQSVANIDLATASADTRAMLKASFARLTPLMEQVALL